MPAVSGDDPRRHRRHKIRIAIELGARGRLEGCVTEDVSLGGCQVGVLFSLQQGELVPVRFRSHRLADQPGGATTVAWATREPPHRVGLKLSGSPNEQMLSFLRSLLGPVQLLTRNP